MYKLYEHTFYLNTEHAIFINGRLGNQHSHTWELTLTIKDFNEKFMQFNELKNWLNPIMSPYEKKFMNDVEPFNKINPTLENVCKYFNENFFEILKSHNMFLEKLRMCESIKCSYIIINDDDWNEKEQKTEKVDEIDKANDELLNSILNKYL